MLLQRKVSISSHSASQPVPRRPKPISTEGQDSRYQELLMKQIAELNTKSRIPNPIPRGGLAIVPTAVSGGGDIMCAMTMALRLKQQGLGPLSVLVIEGMHKGRNAAIIDKIKNDPQFAGITVHSIHELPTGFKIPRCDFRTRGK